MFEENNRIYTCTCNGIFTAFDVLVCNRNRKQK